MPTVRDLHGDGAVVEVERGIPPPTDVLLPVLADHDVLRRVGQPAVVLPH